MSQDSFGSSDLCRALFKNAVEISQKLADLYRSTKTYHDVISPQTVLLRGQLKDLCLKIMLESPFEYGSRAEDFAWRKVFYEPIQLLKKLQRRTALSKDMGLATAIKIQVLSAIGFYQYLLVSLQTRYSLNLKNILDIPVIHEPLLHHRTPGSNFVAVVDKETRDAALDLVYRALVCLGNLARYQCGYLDDWTKTLPTRYYLQALMLKPDCGLPHNQLALLAGSRIVEGAYHWLLCLTSKEPFLPARRNLFDVLGRVHKRISVMRKTTTTSMKTMCSQLMALVYQFLNLIETHRSPSDQAIDNLRSSCDHVAFNLNYYLQKCALASSLTEKSTDSGNGSKMLPADLLFKLTVVYQATVYMMEKHLDKNSQRDTFETVLNMAIGQCASIALIELRYCRDRMLLRTGQEEIKTDIPVKAENINSVRPVESELKKPRRRRPDIKMWNEFESDDNDEDIHPIREESEDNGKSDDDGDDLSFSSGGSSVGGYLSSVEDQENIVSVEKQDRKLPKMTPYEAIAGETWLPMVKLIGDWIISNPHTINSEGFPRKEDFFSVYCSLLNQLPSCEIILVNGQNEIRPAIAAHVARLETNLSTWTQHFVLPEDRAVAHFPALSKSQNAMEMSPNQSITRIMNTHEATALRLAAIFHFARTCEWITFDPISGQYSLRSERPGQKEMSPNNLYNFQSDEDRQFNKKSETMQKQQQMKTMAELWLKSEIGRLEKQQNRGSSSTAVVPIYAVLSGDCFLTHEGVKEVGKLLATKKLIVALPQAVIYHLDAMKTSNPAAREASRFIENELRKGNPYLRIYNQEPIFAEMAREQDLDTLFCTLPAAVAVVSQLLSENKVVPAISRYLVAIVCEKSALNLPDQISDYISQEIGKLPHGHQCVQLKSIRNLLKDIEIASIPG